MLEPGDNLPPLSCSHSVTTALKAVSTSLLLKNGNETFETPSGRIVLVRDESKFSIAYLSDTDASWRRSQLSIIDLAQFVEQLYPARIQTAKGKHKGIVIAAPHAPSPSSARNPSGSS